MLKAELHNKLPEALAQKEDLLTSNILGSLTSLPASQVLIPWLLQARRYAPRARDRGPFLESPQDLTDAVVHFWPRAGTREADAALRLHFQNGGTEDAVIECKYHSGLSPKASEARPDGTAHGQQLVDYGRALSRGDVWTRGGLR